MESREYIQSYILRARTALEEFNSWDQAGVDRLVRSIGKVVFNNAEALAAMAVDETGMGVYEDKVLKNRGKAGIIWNDLKGKPSVGIIGRDDPRGLVEVANPVGIIAAVTPCTNPVVTPMCNAMFALKGRNAIIITPHHRAFNTTSRTVALINRELAGLGAPENLIQILETQSRENTRELMSESDVIVATGGMGMVKAAYSSGKPAFGVGAGNVQCIIDRDIDFRQAVEKIIRGRIFDNGIICSGEQSVIVHSDDLSEVLEAFGKSGGWLAPEERTGNFRNALFPEGKMNGKLIGQSVRAIGLAAGVDIPLECRVVLLMAKGAGEDDLLSREKMCPVLTVYTWNTFDEAVSIAKLNLEYEGRGHSVSIHSNKRERVEQAALSLPASRFIINQSCSTSAGGSFHNAMAPTTTLGCGTWGNNSISENLTYTHLLNISRIGYYIENSIVPSDEELWGEE